MTADEFKRIREASALTQKELAMWLDVDLRSVQKWEGGERSVSGPVAKLMRYLDTGKIDTPGPRTPETK